MDCNTIASQIYAKFLYKPTQNQKKIIEQAANFLSDDDFSRIFVLNGYAGTGKTTFIAALVAALAELKVSTILLAPTGRAAKVLARYSSAPAYTIHKRIYRQRTSSSFESKFSLDINRSHDTVFIVDEASMLSNRSVMEGAVFGSGALLDDLLKYVRSGQRCRLMLIGDNAQLPPVGEERSPALDAGELLPYGDVEYATMDEVVRQEQNSGILFNATMVRCMLENELYEIPHFALDGYDDIRSIGGGELMEELEDCYSRYGKDDVIVITRSNKRANRYNEGIRNTIFSVEDELESDDRLMIVKNNYYYAEHQADEGEEPKVAFFANGDIARLKRLRRVEELYGFRFGTATVAFDDYGEMEVECKLLLDTLHSEAPSLSRDESFRLYSEIEKDYANIPSKAKRYREIRENEYYNAMQIKFAYAVTCHKAQGGQWRAVFVDRLMFGDEPMTRDMMRWLYTALTRATERLYLVNFDERFF